MRHMDVKSLLLMCGTRPQPPTSALMRIYTSEAFHVNMSLPLMCIYTTEVELCLEQLLSRVPLRQHMYVVEGHSRQIQPIADRVRETES